MRNFDPPGTLGLASRFLTLNPNVSGVKSKFRGGEGTLKQIAPPYDVEHSVNVVSTTVRAILEPKIGGGYEEE